MHLLFYWLGSLARLMQIITAIVAIIASNSYNTVIINVAVAADLSNSSFDK
jgi:hypothetical protein